MKESFGNLFDYLSWRGDLTFEHSPLNVVDALIFSVLSYLDCEKLMGDKTSTVEGVTLWDINRATQERTERDYSKGVTGRERFCEFVQTVSRTKRFRDIRICLYTSKFDDQIGQQFSGVTFILPDGLVFVAFRGTDNTMTGWKEDFNMSFLHGTPGQLAAEDYLNQVARLYDGTICVGGHSKGGNFAVWAGVRIAREARDRVAHIYNNDGPGFTTEFLESEAYRAMEPKILSFVPESSIVGVLLSHCDYVSIKSTNYSLLQHDPFSWEIVGKRFVYDNERTKSSKLIEQKVNGMLAGLTDEEKSALVDEIFEVLDHREISTTDDLKNNTFKHLLFTVPKIVGKFKKYGSSGKGMPVRAMT